MNTNQQIPAAATLQALVPISIPSKYDFVIFAAPISPEVPDSFYDCRRRSRQPVSIR